MRRKILGVLVCMLLIATMVPAVTSVKNYAINTVGPTTQQTSMTEDWTEIQKLLASDGTAYDYFGYSVSLDGDTALIGADGDDDNGNNSGSAYVYTRSGAFWFQQAKLLPSDGCQHAGFGCSVSLSGDTALIGAPVDYWGNPTGSAYIFIRIGGTWSQQAKLTPPDGQPSDFFGYSVSLDGDTALIGAQGYFAQDKIGYAYVYTRSGTTWSPQQKLFASDGGEGNYFGCSVSLSGDTALIGASGVTFGGAAYVFTRNGTTWAQQTKLRAFDTSSGDKFGDSVFLENNTALIGACFNDDSGSAYIFTRNGNTWYQKAKLFASDGESGDRFGHSVSLDRDTALIGADGDNNYTGAAYVFIRSGTTWTQQAKLLSNDGAKEDCFGYPVSLDGNTALIGACYDDDNGEYSGSAYVFTKEGVLPGFTFDITGGLGVNLKITNNGTTKSTTANWQINVEGGMLGKINKTINGTVDIPVGETKTVGTGLFFGLGPITITAKVADEEQTVTGTQFIIFSMVK